MKITHIKITDIIPIRHFEISDLSNVTIIAGANGSGKTRLKEAIINTFRSPQSPQVDLTITSTRPKQEADVWRSIQIEVKKGTQGTQLENYMNSRVRGGAYTGTAIQVDSNRSVQPVKFQQITLATPDPDDVELDYKYYLNPFVGRWQEIVNKIFQKVANRDTKIAKYNKENPEGKISEALKKHPDPFILYQKVFKKLLPGKTLEPIDPKQLREFQYRAGESNPLSFNSLSSGEQEVIKITFDLIWKRIKHCIIFVDEPELHLHPTLAFRLIETIKNIGDSTNQFFFFTHSADLISTYYSTGNVFFIDAQQSEGNQAHKLSKLDSKHSQTAKALGDNLGIFAVGKQLVFVEGEDSSIDRLTYHKIAQKHFSEASIIPTGSVENILALNRITDELNSSVFGINFFMIRDRDGLTEEQIESLERNPRFKCLKRRHIENYFLNANILAKIARQFYLDDHWKDETNIDSALIEIANDNLKNALMLNIKSYFLVNGVISAPRIKKLIEKDFSDIENEICDLASNNLISINEVFSGTKLSQFFQTEKLTLEKALQNGSWINIFPGKIIFSIFCGNYLKHDADKVREAYVDITIKENLDAMSDVENIFKDFNEL